MTVRRGEGKGVGFDEIYEPVRGVKHVDWGIDYMCEHIIDAGEMDMNPVYQRGHVWSRNQQMDFVGFLLEGGRPPEVFVRELPLGAVLKPPYYEVVDGKQRITALHAWWNGKIAARLSAENDQRLIWVSDLTLIEVRQAKNHLHTSVQFLDTDLKKTLRIYLRLNRGGTPHSDAEIARVQKLYEETTCAR